MDDEQSRGIATLWYNSANMVAFSKRTEIPKTPFYLYIANRLNSTAGMNVVHNALYARRYAEFAKSADVDYAVFYPDYEGMKSTDRSAERLPGGKGEVYNYLSSFDFRKLPGVSQTGAASNEEQAGHIREPRRHCSLACECSTLSFHPLFTPSSDALLLPRARRRRLHDRARPVAARAGALAAVAAERCVQGGDPQGLHGDRRSPNRYTVFPRVAWRRIAASWRTGWRYRLRRPSARRASAATPRT